MAKGITRLIDVTAAKAASAVEDLEEAVKRAARAIRDAVKRQKA